MTSYFYVLGHSWPNISRINVFNIWSWNTKTKFRAAISKIDRIDKVIDTPCIFMFQDTRDSNISRINAFDISIIYLLINCINWEIEKTDATNTIFQNLP